MVTSGSGPSVSERVMQRSKSKRVSDGSSSRLFGAHVSVSGGFANAIRNGTELGATAIQLHPSPPQRWNHQPYPPGFEDEFVELRASSPIRSVFFHGVYLINLASSDEALAERSMRSLVHYLDLMHRVRGDGVIFHVGSLKDHSDEAEGLRVAARRIDKILEEAEGEGRLLLEVSAGSGSVIGARLQQLAAIYDQLNDRSRVAFALDTQHLWASGYDVRERLEDIIDEIDRTLSLEQVIAIHLNDSKSACGSRKDRHENLGEGLIGEEALRNVVNHPKLRSIPFILETPGLKEMETAREQVNVLRRWIGEGSPART